MQLPVKGTISTKELPMSKQMTTIRKRMAEAKRQAMGWSLTHPLALYGVILGILSNNSDDDPMEKPSSLPDEPAHMSAPEMSLPVWILPIADSQSQSAVRWFSQGC